MEENSEPSHSNRAVLKIPKPARELKVEDALLYLDQVKMEFSDKPHIYNEFLEIMKNFKAQSINTPGVIERVKNLFRGYNKLILGFNTFLPEGEGYKIELTAEEQAMSYPGQNPEERQDATHSNQSGPQTSNSNNQNQGQAQGQGQGQRDRDGREWDSNNNSNNNNNNPGQNSTAPGRYSANASGSSVHHNERGNGGGMMSNNNLIMGASSAPHDTGGGGGGGGGMRGSTPLPFTANGSAAGGGGGGGGGLLNTMGGGLISSSMGQGGQGNNAQSGQNNGGPGQQGQGQNQQGQGLGIGAPPLGQDGNRVFKQPQQMQQQHAIHYVTTIRNRFANEPDTYRSFLKILHTYQKEQRGIKDVLEQVSHLFADHPDLLMEFTYFLPDAVQEQAKERLHRAARESEVRRRMLITKQNQQQQQQQAPPAGSGPILPAQGSHGPPGPTGPAVKRGRDGVPKETAASRKNAAAANAAAVGGGIWGGNPATAPPQAPSAATAASQPKKVARKKNIPYTGGPDMTSTFPPFPIRDVPAKENAPVPTVSKEVKDGHNAVLKEHNSMMKMMKEMTAQQALSASTSDKGKDKDKDRKEDKKEDRDAPIAHSHISVSTERKFFDQAKELLTSVSRESWTEFVRCLDLFSCDAVSKRDLFALVQDLFGPANCELFDEFKILMATRANYAANTSDMWYATPLSEIDFSQCRKCTPSYRALPKSYPKPVCSERSEVEASLLNDVWVGIPIGSEESYSFRFMRKNQYEEALFKCEDDQFEIDMIIDTNTSAIRILEPIAEEIGSLRMLMEASEKSSPRFSFQLEKRSLGTVHLNAVTRLYGDLAEDILNLLRKNPAGTIPVVLKRLKQKDCEWRRARLDLQKQWKEVLNRNYEKSFDHRSFYFRHQDKRSYTAKLLINEIKTMALEPGYSLQDFTSAGLSFQVPQDKVKLLGNVSAPTSAAGSSLPFTPPLSNWSPQLTMAYRTNYQLVHRDVYRVLCHAAECLVSSSTEKERLPALWRDLLRVFFNMPVHYLYGGSTASYAAYGQSDFVTVDPSEAWAEGTKVVTIYGSGTVLKFTATDSLYQVQLPFGVGYLVPSAILGAEELSSQALQAIGVTDPGPSPTPDSVPTPIPTAATTSAPSASPTEPVPSVQDPCQIFYGTQWCYIFFRLHHTIFTRLCAARDMSLSMSTGDQDSRNKTDEETTGEMDIVLESVGTGSAAEVTSSTQKHRNSGSKPPYQAFLGQLYALIEGAIDSNRYEDSCRQLLGNASYTLFGLDKVIQQTLKCLQAMTNDESVNKLIGLFVYHKSKGRTATGNPATLPNNTPVPPSFSTTSSDTVDADQGPLSDKEKAKDREREREKEKEKGKVEQSLGCKADGSDEANALSDSQKDSYGSVNVSDYQAHVSKVLTSSTEDIYRIQLLSFGNFEAENEHQHVVCQCLGVLGVGGIPVYSPPAIASLALQSVAAAETVPISSAPVMSSSTTFASISNITATVYAAESIGDELSTKALEDALLPPLPPPSSLSHSLSPPLISQTYPPVRRDAYWGQSGPDGSEGYSVDKRDDTQKYGNGSGNGNGSLLDKSEAEMKEGSAEQLYIKREVASLKMLVPNQVYTYAPSRESSEAGVEGSSGRGREREREGDRDDDGETDLNMNGEPVHIAEVCGGEGEGEEVEGVVERDGDAMIVEEQ